MAQQHADEDEDLIEDDKPAKKRAVRVVKAGKATVQTAKAPSVTVEPKLLDKAGITQAYAADVYEQAYERFMQRKQEEREDDDEVTELVRHLTQRRMIAVKSLRAAIESLKDLL